MSPSHDTAKTLLSEIIMAMLIAETQLDDRKEAKLANLRLLKIACDEIASGKAAYNADQIGMDSAPFRRNRSLLGAVNVSNYVKVMRLREGEKSWRGLHASTLRGDEGLSAYLKARRAEMPGYEPTDPDYGRDRLALLAQLLGRKPRRGRS